jgi:hypothetical protein
MSDARVRGAPATYRLSVRVNRDQGGPVAAAMVDGDRLAASGALHILLLVHGFNNSRQDAEKSYAIFSNHILPGLTRSRVGPDAIAQFHWPGDESVGFLPRAVGYATDLERAFTAAQRLAQFLATLTRLRGGETPLNITFVGHSLGCRLILESLRQLPAASAPNVPVIGLMAAAVPVELAKRGTPIFRTGNPPRQLLKFCSEADEVLYLAFPLGQYAAYQSGVESAAYGEAMGRFGNPDEFGARSKRPGNGHSDYWKDSVVVDIMLAHIDPTLRQLPPVADTSERSLAREAALPERSLPGRNAPFESV